MDEPRQTPAAGLNRTSGLNPTNLPEFTVSEISGAIKRSLEGEFGRVRVRGEITEMKRYPSGHIYFSLKDESSKLSGIVWRNAVSRLGLVPENGVEVVATGRISAYGERSSYQMIVERMEYAGAGALLARIEMLRVRLAAEGLFDADRKRPLPMLPNVIGVVTSERGAVIQDIRTTILRRFPRNILVWSVAVQGAGAAEQIAAAISGFDALPPGGQVARPDVLIVARGGAQSGRPDGVQRGNRVARGRRLPHSIDLGGWSRDRYDTDRLRLRPSRTHADGGGRDGDSRAGRSARRPGAESSASGGRIGAGNEREAAAPDPGRARATRPAVSVGHGAATFARRSPGRPGWLMALPNLLERRRAALAAFSGKLPDLPAIILAMHDRLRDRGARLVLALPNLVTVRRHALGLAQGSNDCCPACVRPSA